MALQEMIFPEVEYSFAEDSLEDLQLAAETLLKEHRTSPITDEEFEKHYEYIRRVRKTYPSTHKTNTLKEKGKTVYSQTRLDLHKKIVTDFLVSVKDTPKERKAAFIGGISGAGKTSILQTSELIPLSAYAIVNPDETKRLMINEGMYPDVPGLLPLETDELIKYEAQIITEKIFSSLIALGVNIVLDRTMANKNQVLNPAKTFEENSYKDFIGIFVDVDPSEAFKRVRLRHRKGIDAWVMHREGFGERPVPGNAIKSTLTETPGFNSKNAEIFKELEALKVFTETHFISN